MTRRFGEVMAVDDVSLTVPAGVIFGFLGPNGAGKTTTIRLLLGLIEPNAGQVEVLGLDTRTAGQGIREQCGALLEHSGLYERLTAEENLRFYGRAWHLERAELDTRIRELLTHLGLWERRGDLVGKWSRGMKQKLAVARALLHRPSLVFLDEPTAGLDPVAAAALREDLLTLASAQGVTVFLTTHNLVEAERVCGLVGVIRQGRLLAVGPPEELRRTARAPHIEIGGQGFTSEVLQRLRELPEVVSLEGQPDRLVVEVRDGARPHGLVSLLVHAGAEVDEVRRQTATLEEVFLSLVEEGDG